MQQDGCRGAKPVAGGWLDAEPSCIAGGFAALQQKKEGYFKMQLHLQLIFPHTCGRLLQTSSCAQVASCQLVKKLLGCLHKKASAKQSRGGRGGRLIESSGMESPPAVNRQYLCPLNSSK